MADNSNKKKPEGSTIDLSEPGQLEYWTEFLGCTESQLRSVIKLAGNSLKDVKKYFRKS